MGEIYVSDSWNKGFLPVLTDLNYVSTKNRLPKQVPV